MNAGTFVRVTSVTFPSFTWAFVLMIPAGASKTTSFSPSWHSTRPASRATVTAPIVQCPHMFRYPPVSMKITPRSASSWIGSQRKAPNISWCPLGSSINAVRTWSYFSSIHFFFSIIVLPSGSGNPPMTIRQNSPAVWASTTWSASSNRSKLTFASNFIILTSLWFSYRNNL